jgi:nicotinate-nucleotide pyrophosphorylase (carboxylating)
VWYLWDSMNHLELDAFLRQALAEDIGPGDLTTEAIVPAGARARGVVRVKEAGVIAGLEVAARVFALLDPGSRWRARAADGDWIASAPRDVAEVEGSARALLSGERVALNLLQRLSGIATAARRAVEVAGGRLTILDTRKTTPGLRMLEKWAVRLGGARNHRFALYDGVLIKDNHIRAAGGLAEAVRRVRAGVPPGLKIEVEASTLAEVTEAVAAGADIVLLDNMPPAAMREAVAAIGGRARTEASGGITLANLADVAATGVDYASLGALTHSAPALDISLKLVAP